MIKAFNITKKLTTLYVALLLFVSCSGEPEKQRLNIISLSSCSSIAKLLDGSFAYSKDYKEPCTVYIENGEYYFYSDDEERGIRFGLAMSINRKKLKDLYKCIKPADLIDSFEEKIKIDRACRKKLGMVDYY